MRLQAYVDLGMHLFLDWNSETSIGRDLNCGTFMINGVLRVVICFVTQRMWISLKSIFIGTLAKEKKITISMKILKVKLLEY